MTIGLEKVSTCRLLPKFVGLKGKEWNPRKRKLKMTVKYKGIKWPSPSNIIPDVTDKSGALTQWAANMAVEWIRENSEPSRLSENKYLVTEDELNKARFNFRNVSKRALNVGSQVHDAIRLWIVSGKEPSEPDEQVLSAFVAFLEFFDANKMETIKTEERLFHDDWCMQYDWYGLFNGKKFVLDWKSSKDFYREMRIQVAAYRGGLVLKGNEVEGHGCVRLDKETGLCHFKDYSKFYEQDWAEFLLSKELYFVRHPIIRKQFEDKKPF